MQLALAAHPRSPNRRSDGLLCPHELCANEVKGMQLHPPNARGAGSSHAHPTQGGRSQATVPLWC